MFNHIGNISPPLVTTGVNKGIFKFYYKIDLAGWVLLAGFYLTHLKCIPHARHQSLQSRWTYMGIWAWIFGHVNELFGRLAFGPPDPLHGTAIVVHCVDADVAARNLTQRTTAGLPSVVCRGRYLFLLKVPHGGVCTVFHERPLAPVLEGPLHVHDLSEQSLFVCVCVFMFVGIPGPLRNNP
jgi:hypothetical protein